MLPETHDEHTALVKRLAKPPADIMRELSAETVNLMHMALGVAGEAGEIVDAVKKAAIYGKPLNVENLVEELGDIHYYLEGLRQAIGVSREDILKSNIRKLERRYGNGAYSNEQALARADKKEEPHE